MKKEIVRNTDYQKEERPETRFKQFFDIFFHRFVELLKLSLLQAVFNMPLVVSLVLFHQLVRSSTSMGSLMTVFLIQGGSLLISMPSVFVGLTGVFYCFKKIIHSDGEYASSSFFIGMREEWKNGLLIGLIAGFSFALTVIGCFYFYYYVPSFNTVIAGFGIAILIIQALIVLMVCYYSIGQVVFYKNPLRYVLKNSFIMTLIRFPINLLLTIIHPGILVALFVIMDITMYVGIVLLIFLVGIGHLIWNLNVISAFDKYINKENYKDIYLKGLSTYNKEE
jgi:hypothetical protein